MNRDYFTCPIQGGGCDAHDYGNTRLGPEDCRKGSLRGFALLLCALAIITPN